jgi:hypothetical protein
MGAKALFASVLIFDLERMSVGTFDLNSHVRPASRTVEDVEKLGAESKDLGVKILLRATGSLITATVASNSDPGEL